MEVCFLSSGMGPQSLIYTSNPLLVPGLPLKSFAIVNRTSYFGQLNHIITYPTNTRSSAVMCCRYIVPFCIAT
jgi:hypothetical protein